jgi:hypothetical protein
MFVILCNKLHFCTTGMLHCRINYFKIIKISPDYWQNLTKTTSKATQYYTWEKYDIWYTMYVQQPPYYKANNPSAIKIGFYKMCVASLEGDNWAEFCYHSASEIWPGKSGGLWWEWPGKRDCLWWEWPYKREATVIICNFNMF